MSKQTQLKGMRGRFFRDLGIGDHIVEISRIVDGSTYTALISITSNTNVLIMPKPRPEDMYASFTRVTEASLQTPQPVGGVWVWPYKDADLMSRFRGNARIRYDLKKILEESTSPMKS